MDLMIEIELQGDSGGRECGLGLLRFWSLDWLTSSAWPDGNLAEQDSQQGGKMKH